MRRLILSVVLIVGVVALADRVAAFAAERTVALRIQQDQSLAVRPTVTVAGFPFLTQLFRGRYDRVDVSVHDLRRGGLHIDKVVAHLRDVDVPFSSVLHQNVKRIVVTSATGEVDLDYTDVDQLLGSKHLRLSDGAGGKVHVAASASVGGAGLHIDGDFPLTVQDSALVIVLPGGQSVQIALPTLPFGIKLRSAAATAGGIVIRCSTSGFILRP